MLQLVPAAFPVASAVLVVPGASPPLPDRLPVFVQFQVFLVSPRSANFNHLVVGRGEGTSGSLPGLLPGGCDGHGRSPLEKALGHAQQWPVGIGLGDERRRAEELDVWGRFHDVGGSEEVLGDLFRVSVLTVRRGRQVGQLKLPARLQER